ncbi:ABC transporter substrate-binding protein [Lutispora sp.]|uniref:ABC transporter substrate-binding protein n=1 Tax=Lutispora sp. TaxID=2828727 RepID=UPI002B1F26D0|nr:ABC transporter substrate-binding protein [Lutispora sp.]MEA4960586.1 ABC transporter substrate-binding protein [Lutispora sp.]
MKLRKTISLLLCALLVLAMLTGCKQQNQEQAEGAAAGEAPEVTILSIAKNETAVNVVRDQLTKSGFRVKLNLQPDYSSYAAQAEANNFDLLIGDWTTTIGNGDYAVRALFRSDGSSNRTGINDPEIDSLIDKAATLTSDKAIDVYREFEEKLVNENAYVIPLYNTIKSWAYNKEVMKPVRIKKGREAAWEQFDFVDESKRDTAVLVITDIFDTITSLDPIKANDGATVMNNANMFVRLMNLDDENIPTTVGTLSYNYAIAEGNSEVYFILRDDINFTKVENKHAVDSGVMVGGEDVVYSLNRAMNKDSVPEHRTYSVHASLKSAEILTDTSELDNVKLTGSSKSIREELEKGLKTPISKIIENKKDVNNAKGNYQIIKVTTKTPFPQILNTLAHPSAGIVCKEQIEKINTYDIATYDRTKDIAYGDQSVIVEGDTYNNHLYCSGPYIPIYKNDYEIFFEKNPNYMRGTESEPKVAKISSKIIKDVDSSISALRSGEVHFVKRLEVQHYDIIKNEAKLQLIQIPSNSVHHMDCNMNPSSICSDENIRKAILYSVNQDEFVAVFNNQVKKAFSTLTPVMDTGLEHKADLAKAKEYLNAYFESKK